MSASSKKKLRKEQYAAELTEKQLQEKAESKKLKAYSTIFIVCILVVVIAAVAILGVTTVKRYGIIEKNTIAATVGDEKFNSVQMNYYFTDAVNSTMTQWQNAYGDSAALYAMMLGLDMSMPLDEQQFEENGGTWADYFYDLALDQAKSDYILCKKASNEGFVLPEEEIKAIDDAISQIEFYMTLYGYNSVDDYLRATYGNGASKDSYYDYSITSATAAAYYEAYKDSLTFEEAELRAHEAENYKLYNSYSYASYYVNYNSYLEGGTEDEEGKVTYSEEEKNAARAKAEEVAKMLTEYDSVEGLDAAIAALPIENTTEGTVSTKYDRTLYSTINSTIIDWITDDARQNGDVTYIANTSTTTDADGNEAQVTNGYYVLFFQQCHENLRPLANVRHLLVQFESESGSTEYTDEEKAAAKAEAEKLLEQWKAGEATEDSFIELVKENSGDISAETGGLYEDITPEQGVYVENFTKWAVDESRKPGDVDVIETEYGYHVMYYVGDSDINYRDYMITNDLRVSALTLWFEELTADITATKGDLSHINTGLVLQPAAE